MNAIVWKKIRFFEKKPIRLFFLFVVPIIYLYVISKIYFIESNVIVAYFPLVVTLFNLIFMDNMEDTLYCEPLFATSLSNKKIWWLNLFIFTVPNYLYSVLLLIFCAPIIGIRNITTAAIFQCILGFFLTFGVLANATIWHCDLSKFKQWLSVPFNIVSLAFPILIIVLRKIIVVSFLSNMLSMLLLFVLVLNVAMLLKTVSNETLINNLQMLVNAYEYKMIND